MIVLTSTNFKKQVLEEKKKPVFVLFTSTFCSHCKAFAPVFKSVAKAHGHEFRFGTVNLSIVGNQPMASQYRIMGTPQTLIFFQGEVVGSVDGAYSEADFIRTAIVPAQEEMAKLRSTGKGKKG